MDTFERQDAEKVLRLAEPMTQAVLQYLNDKYGAEHSFRVLEVQAGFDSTPLVRFSCTAGDKHFYVLLRDNPGREVESITVNGERMKIMEKFDQSVFEEACAAFLKSRIPAATAVRCVVSIPGVQLSAEQYRSGMEACVGSESLQSYVMAYVMLNAPVDTAAAEQEAAALNAYRMNLYLIQPAGDKPKDLDAAYEKNSECFEDFLLGSGFASRVDYALIRRDGSISRHVIEKR